MAEVAVLSWTNCVKGRGFKAWNWSKHKHTNILACYIQIYYISKVFKKTQQNRNTYFQLNGLQTVFYMDLLHTKQTALYNSHSGQNSRAIKDKTKLNPCDCILRQVNYVNSKESSSRCSRENKRLFDCCSGFSGIALRIVAPEIIVFSRLFTAT